MPEWIVLLEQEQHGEIGHVPEYTGDSEARIRCAPQRGRRAEIVETLQVHGAMRLQLVDLVHYVKK